MDLVEGWVAGPWLVPVVAVMAVTATAGAAVLGYVVGRRAALRRPRPGDPPPPPPVKPPVTPLVTPPAGPDRDLVLGLIGAHDLATTHDAVRVHVEQVLRRAGVRPVVVEPGAPFDPDTQAAVATEDPTDPATPGTVARTVRPGWRDDGMTYRPAEVAVWTP